MKITKMSLLFFFLFSFPLLSFSQNTTSKPYYIPLNPRLEKAYKALQAWKHAITSDPKNITANWCGPHVCNYTGVYCAPAPNNSCEYTVAGIDLNHGLLGGYLPEELGLLSDLALFHINSNNFHGTIPKSFGCMSLLFELDLSNNQFEGTFPSVVFQLPSLKFLDIRFNKYYGSVPEKLWDLKLDALFFNNNNFTLSLPENIENSPVSVLVMANNRIRGCFPKTIVNMAKTLNQLIILNCSWRTCIPHDIGKLMNLTVFDISFNRFQGELPESIGMMKSLEQLDVSHNMLYGDIPASICKLPNLQNFTYSDNYFCGVPEICMKIEAQDDRQNCIAGRPDQRPVEQCLEFLHQPKVQCDSNGCILNPPPMSSPPPPIW